MQGIDNYEYAQWVISIGRSLRLNPAEVGSAELTMVEQFCSFEGYAARTWLKDKFIARSEMVQGLVTTDNPQVLGKLVEVIGRDMMKIQIQNLFEKLFVDLLIAATGNRRFGDKGARSGADVGTQWVPSEPEPV